MTCFRSLLLAIACVLLPWSAAAQTAPIPTPPPDPPEQTDPDVRVDALQPDFNLAALPTTLRMPVHKLAFRVTHRFTRALGEGDFGDLANDFFGFDSGAQIGGYLTPDQMLSKLDSMKESDAPKSTAAK